MKKVLVISLLALALSLLSISVAIADGGTVHHVQPGENLAWIAADYGVTPQSIMNANGISNPDWIYAGQKLVIPSTGYSGCSQHYTVQWGDTLSGIAWKFGMASYDVAAANGFTGDMIHEGQKLCIPGTASAHAGYASAPVHHYHVVEAGESVSGIAYKYGVSPDAIVKVNGLASAGWINIGQKLAIPGYKPQANTAKPHKKKAASKPKYVKHESKASGYSCTSPTDVWAHKEYVLVETIQAWCPWYDIIDSPDQMTSMVVRVRGRTNARVKLQRGNDAPIELITGSAPGYDSDYGWLPIAPGYYKVWVDESEPSGSIELDVAAGKRGWVDFQLTSVSKYPRPRNNQGWSGKVTSYKGEPTAQNGVSSVIIVRGPADGLPIRIDAEGSFTARCYTGQKPELGGGACEFGGMWPGKYTLTLEGAGVSVEVFVDGIAPAEVTFDRL